MKISNAEYIKKILASDLFLNCSSAFKDLVISSGEIVSFDPGKEFLIDNNCSSHIGIILEGKAVVYSGLGSESTPLRFLTSGDIYGVAGIFLDQPIVSKIYAINHCCVFMLTKEHIYDLFKHDTDGTFRTSLLVLLSKKVRFLNNRFRNVCAGTNEQKLALYLLSNATDSGTIHVKVPMKDLAAALGMGRASLYRAIESLEKSGYITRDSDSFTIKDVDALSTQLV